MHEISIATCLIDEVLHQVELRDGVKVEAVHLRLGALSGVDHEALVFSYGMAVEGTPLAGTRLVIEQVPLLTRCSRCGAEHVPSSAWDLQCPACPGIRQEIIQGREIELSALEVAT